MYTIVVFLLNEKYRQEITDYFRLPQFDLHLTTDEREVVDICGKELVDIILVWDANIQAIQHLQAKLNKMQIEAIPLIPIVNDSENFHASIEAGTFNAIQIPMPRMEFTKIITQLLEFERDASHQVNQKIADDLTEASNLINSLHRLSKNRESALITVTQTGHSGRIYVREGKIVRAIFRVLEGMDALNKMIGLYKAEMTIHVTEVVDEDQFKLEVPDILVKLHQRLNEQRKNFGYHLSDSEILVVNDEESEESPKLSDLQRQIMKLMAKGETAYNILTILNQDNLDILQALKLLSEQNLIVPERRQLPEPPKKIKEKPPRKFFDFFRKFFNRTPKSNEIIEEKNLEEFEPELNQEPVLNSAEVVPNQIDTEIRQKIKSYFTGLHNADS